MPQFYVCTEAVIERTYAVVADTLELAKQLIETGQLDFIEPIEETDVYGGDSGQHFVTGVIAEDDPQHPVFYSSPFQLVNQEVSA